MLYGLIGFALFLMRGDYERGYREDFKRSIKRTGDVQGLYRFRDYLNAEQNKDVIKKIILFVNEVRQNKSTDRNNLMETTRRVKNITNKLIREFR
jgi:hypothetical protein